jgi:FixJ family two-component response regulator
MTAESVVATESPTVFVVDDDPAVRKSLRWLMESVGLKVQTYSSGVEFLAAYNADRPGCVVLDVRMPGMSGLELQEQLQDRGCRLPVIIVTAYGDVPMAVRTIKSGAVHFFEKPVSDQVLLDQIQRALADDLARRQQDLQLSHLETRFARLTKREREVLERVIAGMSSREIGEQLGVSYKTIEAHRAKIMRRMEAGSVADLMRIYFSLNAGRQRTTAPPKG